MGDTNGGKKRTFELREKRTAAMDKEILDVPRAASLLGLSEAAVYYLARKGEIPARKVGREWRFARTNVVNWIARDTKDRDLTELFKHARVRK